MSFQKSIRGVPLSYIIIKNTPSTNGSEIRYVQIVYNASIVKNISIKNSRKVLNILKEPTIVNDAVI